MNDISTLRSHLWRELTRLIDLCRIEILKVGLNVLLEMHINRFLLTLIVAWLVPTLFMPFDIQLSEPGTTLQEICWCVPFDQ